MRHRSSTSTPHFRIPNSIATRLRTSWGVCAGANVQALACTGEAEANTAEIELLAREIAVANALAFANVRTFCRSSGGPGSRACALGESTVTGIARAQVRRPPACRTPLFLPVGFSFWVLPRDVAETRRRRRGV